MGSSFSKRTLKKVDSVRGFPVSISFLKRALYALPASFLDAKPLACNFDIRWRIGLTGWDGTMANHWAWYFKCDTPMRRLLQLRDVDALDKVVLSDVQHDTLRALNVPCFRTKNSTIERYTFV